FQLMEEAHKLSAAMAGRAASHDLPIQNVKGRRQGGSSVALGVVRLTLRKARSQRQDGSGSIQSRDSALLADAKNQGSVQGIEVKPHDVADLVLELGVVGNLKLFHPMGLLVIALPDAMHP